MIHSLIQDISNISTIPQASLKNLQNKAQLLICNNISQAILKNENVVQIDIGYGTLCICFNQEQVKYRFVPNPKLQERVRSTIKNKKSPLLVEIENILQKKITNAYKELL